MDLDVNIWDEPIIENNNVIYEESKFSAVISGAKLIRFGSLNSIIKLIVVPINRFDYIEFVFFLLTFRSYTTPAKFLEKLIQRFNVPPYGTHAVEEIEKEIENGQNIEEEWNKYTRIIQLRVLNAIKKWIESFPSDFTDSISPSLSSPSSSSSSSSPSSLPSVSLVDSLRAFLYQQQDRWNNLVRSIICVLDKKMELDGESGERDLTEITVPINNSSSLFLELDNMEVAKQLTLIEYSIYNRIKNTEFLNQSWNKPKYKYRSPTIIKNIGHFGRISSWVVSTILRLEDINQRVNVLTKFIEIAEYLRELNNFNNLVAVISALNTAAISRLRQTFEKLNPIVTQKYERLVLLCDSNRAFRALRDAINQAYPPAIPYLGLSLTDLTFAEDGSADYTHSLIRMNKYRLVANCVREVLQFQHTPFSFSENDEVIGILCNCICGPNDMDADTQYRLSLLYEPRK